MTVEELKLALADERKEREILIAIPLSRGKMLIKDVASIHTKAVEDAIIFTTEEASRIQEDLLLQ